jgi:hypothetical protein
VIISDTFFSELKIETNDNTVFHEFNQYVAYTLLVLVRVPLSEHQTQGEEHFVLEYFGSEAICGPVLTMHCLFDCQIQIKDRTIFHKFDQCVADHFHSLAGALLEHVIQSRKQITF